MPHLNAYIFFDGTCADAMRFYEQTLGGKLVLMTNAQSPEGQQCPEGAADRIMHARLVLDDGGILMASDWMAGGEQPYKGMEGFSLALLYPDVDGAKKAFETLGEGGQTIMAMEKTFWAETFGVVVDRFGTSWMISGGPVEG